MNNFNYFVIPMSIDNIKEYNSLEQVKYVIDRYKREEGFSAASVGKFLITLESPKKEDDSILTKHSIEDNKWVLSVDEEEWNRFVLRQLF